MGTRVRSDSNVLMGICPFTLVPQKKLARRFIYAGYLCKFTELAGTLNADSFNFNARPPEPVFRQRACSYTGIVMCNTAIRGITDLIEDDPNVEVDEDNPVIHDFIKERMNHMFLTGFDDLDKIFSTNVSDQKFVNALKKTGTQFILKKIKSRFGVEMLFLYGFGDLDADETWVVIRDRLTTYNKSAEEIPDNIRIFSHNMGSVALSIKNEKGIIDTFLVLKAGIRVYSKEELLLVPTNLPKEAIKIEIYGKQCYQIRNELNEVLKKRTKELGDGGVMLYNVNASTGYSNNGFNVNSQTIPSRRCNTIFFSHGEYDKIKNHANRFIRQEKLYREHQLTHKTGLLLYGTPGTGKTSLVKVLATELNYRIINIDIPSIKRLDLKTIATSITLSTNEGFRFIILLEDIDTLFLNHRSQMKDKEDKEIFNKLLQFLDSNDSPSEVIIIATTNHKEELSKTLIRSGRFDLILEIQELLEPEAIKMIQSFGIVDQKSINKILSDYKEKNPGHEKFNQSELQNFILQQISVKSK